MSTVTLTALRAVSWAVAARAADGAMRGTGAGRATAGTEGATAAVEPAKVRETSARMVGVVVAMAAAATAAAGGMVSAEAVEKELATVGAEGAWGMAAMGMAVVMLVAAEVVA